MSNQQTTIAFFDFDGTIVKGDSLWPFLLEAAGRRRCYAGCARALWARLFCPSTKDKRSIFKDVLLRYTLAGRTVDELAPAVQTLLDWPRWIDKSVAALKDHHAKGHRIVIASGSLDIYLKTLLGDLPFDAILCTEMEEKDGRLTGVSSSGNCVRETKAKRVAEYLAEHGPFEDSIAYGNAPHDFPMMDLVNHRVVVLISRHTGHAASAA